MTFWRIHSVFYICFKRIFHWFNCRVMRTFIMKHGTWWQCPQQLNFGCIEYHNWQCKLSPPNLIHPLLKIWSSISICIFGPCMIWNLYNFFSTIGGLGRRCQCKTSPLPQGSRHFYFYFHFYKEIFKISGRQRTVQRKIRDQHFICSWFTLFRSNTTDGVVILYGG